MNSKSRRHRWLGAWAMFVSRRPRTVLAIAGVMVFLSLAVTLLPVRLPGMARPLGPLGFQSNRNDLISDKLEWNRRFIRWQKQFSGTSDYIFVADAGQEGPAREAKAQAIRAFIDELGPVLAKDPWVRQAVWGFDKRKVSPKAIRLATLDESQPSDEFRRSLAKVAQGETLLASANPADFVSRIVAQMRQQEQQTSDESQAIQGLNGLADVLDALAQSLQAPLNGDAANAPAAGEDWLIRQLNDTADYGEPWQYLVSENGRLYFIRITPKPATDQLNAFEPSIASIRRIMNEVAAKYPSLKLNADFGLTGIDVVETDETEAVSWDGTWTSIVAAILIWSVLVISYHSWRTPGMMMAALVTAIAWTFGFTTLAVGHLQVISVIFVPLLLGLGIAYGIYLAARFEIVRHDYPDTPDGFTLAMRDTFQTMGPGILTGMVTTAAAFMTTVGTDFTGVAEMGLIAGVGVIFCLLAMVTVYPALVRLIKPSHRHIRAIETRTVKPYDDRWFMPFVNHPKMTLAVGGLLTVASLLSLIGMKFNYNLLELQPRGLASADWEHRVVQDGGESIWFGVSIAKDLDEARDLARRYRQQPDVGVVRGVALLMPEDEPRKIELIRHAAQSFEISLKQAKESSPTIPASALAMQVNLLKLGFDREANRSDIPVDVRPAISRVGQSLGRLQSALQQARPSVAPRFDRLEKQFVLWRNTSEKLVRQALDPTPLGLNDLPKEILDSYIAADGSLAVEVFPKLAEGDVLAPTFLPRFISQLKSVDPSVTGVVVQVYESGRLIQQAYVTAGILGLIVVFLLVLIDFKNGRDALLSLLPVIVGFVITFAIMRCCGMTINPANIIVLPLMFGIGVDSGVNMIHRYRMNPDDRPPGLTQGTGKGIVVVNATTLIGFGVLMGAAHRGIQSLGFVLTVGMAMTVLTCLTVMPAWLELRRRKPVSG